MPIRMPDPEQVGLVMPQADRSIASYRGGIAQEAQESTGEGVARVGQGLTAAGSDFANAQDQVQSASAYSSFLQQKLQLDQQFQSDTDYTTSAQRYGDAVQKAAESAGSGIRNVQMRTQFMERVGRMQEFGMDAMVRQAHTKSIQADQGFLQDSLGRTVDAAGQTTDLATRTALYDAADGLIHGMVAKGSITPSEGVRYGQQVRNQASYRYFKTLTDNNPALAARLLGPGAPALSTALPTDLAASIHSAAVTRGADEEVLSRTAQLESGGAHTTNPQSGASGPFQFLPSTGRPYGLADPNDNAASADAAARLQVDNRAALTDSLGRSPTGPELYLAHQQGAAGAAALILHPDLPAVTALTPAYGGDTKKAQAAIVENGGSASMTAGQFAGMWADRYNGTAPHTPGSTPQPTQDDAGNIVYPKSGDLRDFLRPDQRADLARVATDRAQALQRASLVDQERQAALQQKALHDASNEAETRTIADVTGVGDNPGVTATQIADPKGPYNQLLPDAKLRMIGFLDRNAKASDHDAATYGPGFNDMLHRIYAQPGDPTRITDPGTLIENTGPGLGLTVAGLKQLQSEMSAQKTPDGAANAQMKKAFFDAAHVQISQHGIGMNGRDPIGEMKYAQFLQAALPAFDAGIKAGKTAPELLGQDGPIAKLIPQFNRTPAEKMRDFFQANNPDLPAAKTDTATPAPKLDLTTPAGIAAAYKSGHYGVGQAAWDAATADLIKGGFAGTQKPQTAQRTVPTNE